jgi:hypothetical protein
MRGEARGAAHGMMAGMFAKTLLGAGMALSLVLLSTACGSTATSNSSVPVIQTFTSMIQPRGAASTSFPASKDGTVQLTLNSVGSSVSVGFGLGTFDAATGCKLTTTVETTGGTDPQIQADVTAGTYCVRIYDIGNLTANSTFVITIVRP